ncbi:MAG: type I secretion system permease/ATPase [Coxiellaceae bacterium]|nr:type I secretion system permease/ATPase [Coxiellaceae bacterium]
MSDTTPHNETAHDMKSSALLDCLIDLTFFYERRKTKSALTAGLPLKENILPPDLFQKAAQRADFLTKIVRVKFDDIHQKLLPCVVFLNEQDSYVLLAKIEEKTATIIKNQQEHVIPLEMLKQQYGKQIILVRPKIFTANAETPQKLSFFDIGWLWPALKGSWSIYAEVLFATFFINVLVLAMPLFVMNVYDRVVPNTAIATLWVLALGVVFVLAFDFILKTLRTRFIDTAAHSVDTELSGKIFEHVLGIKMKDRPNSTGYLVNTVQGYETFREFMASFSVTILIDFPFTLLFIVFIGLIGGSLFLVPLLLMPAILIVSYLIQKPLVNAVNKNFEISGAKQQTLVETMSGISTVKAQNAESSTQRRWDHMVAFASFLNMRIKFLNSLAINFSTFAQFLGSVLIVIFGVYKIADNELSMGALIACTILAGRALAPIAQVVGYIMRYYQALTSLQSVDRMMKLPIERPTEKKFLYPDEIDMTIKCSHVTLRYAGAKMDSLIDVNLEIKPGEKIGLVGRVGSGKSSLLKALIGFYEPNEGKVYWGGNDIQQLDPMEVRSKLGYVTQEPELFSGSIKDNVVLGNPNASDDEILHAIKLAGVKEMIDRHADGIEMQVGERGKNLSGGQRQSVIVAQALLQNPKILVFDEPTASMDELSEKWFCEKIRGFMGDRTLLLSTHKASMLSLVDRLIVMDHGKVAADGPKDEVLKALHERSIKVQKNED